MRWEHPGRHRIDVTALAFVGLGANLGEPRQALAAAVDALRALPQTSDVAVSRCWRSAPIDSSGPDYLNAVASLRTALPPHALLAELQRIEHDHGRERPYRNAPRTLDLDLLLYGDEVIDSPTLELPHPRLHQRAFVLRPLAELAPATVVPGHGPVQALLPAVADQSIEPAGSLTPLFDSARHIAVEGPIGVGKSSLARRLAARLGADLLMESAGENPFLERFYDDLPGYAFQTQIFFLFQRLRQLQGVAQPGIFSNRIVSDYLFAKDALFARLNLSDDEYRIYAQLYAQAAPQVPEPDLVIWLQAPPAVLLRRIERRGLAMERGIGADYLQRLCDGYAEFFAGYRGAPVFAVGTERLNLVDSDGDFERLVDALRAFDGRRGVLNLPSDEATITQPAALSD